VKSQTLQGAAKSHSLESIRSIARRIGELSSKYTLCECRAEHFLQQVTGHQTCGLPCGQYRLVSIFLAALAERQQPSDLNNILKTALSDGLIESNPAAALFTPPGKAEAEMLQRLQTVGIASPVGASGASHQKNGGSADAR